MVQYKTFNTKDVLHINSRQLFKLVLFCCTGFYVPIGLLIGLLAAFDIVPATMNEQQYTGLEGLAIGVVFIPVFIVILTLSQWIVLAIGLKFGKIGFKLFRRLKESKEGKWFE